MGQSKSEKEDRSRSISIMQSTERNRDSIDVQFPTNLIAVQVCGDVDRI